MQDDSTPPAPSAAIYPAGSVIDLAGLDLEQFSAVAASAQWQLEQFQWGTAGSNLP